MTDQLPMSDQAMLRGTVDVTSSAVFSAGRSPSGSPDGLQHDLFGQAPARVNRSARRVAEKALTMRATSGPPGSGSSASADLQRSLASKLAALMDSRGSLLFALTWKAWDMPWGAPICRLLASARRTNDNDFSGWQFAPWPTPKAEDTESTGAHRGTPDTLTSVARLSLIRGLTSNGCPAVTPPAPSTGQLNPEFPRWLMGFPETWARSDPNWSAWRSWQDFLAKACTPPSGSGDLKSKHTETP